MLDLFVEQWPLLIFVPAVLLLVAVLAGVTRWWDRRDGQRRPNDNTASWGRRGPRGRRTLRADRWEPKPPPVVAAAANALHLSLAHPPN